MILDFGTIIFMWNVQAQKWQIQKFKINVLQA